VLIIHISAASRGKYLSAETFKTLAVPVFIKLLQLPTK